MVAALASATAFAQTQNSIESIEFAYAKAGRTVVRVQLASPAIAAPTAATVNNPPRITLDFADTVSGFKRRAVEVNDVVLRSVNIVPDGSRTRVVFNLNKPQFVEAQLAGDVIVVTLSDRELEAPRAPVASAPQSVPAPRSVTPDVSRPQVAGASGTEPVPSPGRPLIAQAPPQPALQTTPVQTTPVQSAPPPAPIQRSAPVATPAPQMLVPPPPPVVRATPREAVVESKPKDSIEEDADLVEPEDTINDRGGKGRESVAADEHSARLAGFYQFEGAYTMPAPAHFSKLKNRLEASWTGQFSENLKWKLGGGVFYDGIYDLSNFYPGAVRHDQRFDALARENYLDWSTGDFDFRFGRQHIIWGEVVSLFVADVVSARDLREFVLPDFDLIRIPQWAARGEYFKNDFHAEAIFVPRVTVDQIGKPGSDFYPYPPGAPPGYAYVIGDEVKPSSSVSNAAYGTRLSYLKDGWDGAAFYYRSTDISPTFYRKLIGGPAPAAVFTPMHNRISQAGATLSKDFDSYVFKLESVYTTGRDYNVSRIDARNGLVRQNTLDYIVAVDVPLPQDARLNAQFFQRVFFNYDGGTGFNRTESDVSFLFSRQLTSTVTPEILFVTSINRSDWMIRPKVTWLLEKNWRLVGGADFFGGSPTGFFGRYNDRDRTYVELRYSF